MKASLSARSPKGQPHGHTLPRVSGGVTTPEALHRRRCRLELELIANGVPGHEAGLAADLLLRKEAGW
jgi:hypothetical protein